MDNTATTTNTNPLTRAQLKSHTPSNTSTIFNQLLKAARQSPDTSCFRSFDVVCALLMCKIVDEAETKEGVPLGFQWLKVSDTFDSLETRLQVLFREGSRKILNNTVIINAPFSKHPQLVREVVDILQPYHIRNGAFLPFMADFFEALISREQKKGKGQFFTPAPLSQFIAKCLPYDIVVDNKLNGGGRNLLPLVLDFSSGGGNLLDASMVETQRLISNKNTRDYPAAVAEVLKGWQVKPFSWVGDYLYGVEKDPRLLRLNRISYFLHSGNPACLIAGDGLADFNCDAYKGALSVSDPDSPQDNLQFDMVIANPPYGIKGFKDKAKDIYGEKDYELYRHITDKSSSIECLFIERTKQVLKVGGVAGIIMPESTLHKAKVNTKTRELIINHFDIVAITELGSTAFMGTKVATVILFLRKKDSQRTTKYQDCLEAFLSNPKEPVPSHLSYLLQRYLKLAWGGVNRADYTSLLSLTPNRTLRATPLYKEYQRTIPKTTYQKILDKEQEKLRYFFKLYAQRTVVVKLSDKKTSKQFLGYEFSNQTGKEGTTSTETGKSITECTKLFDPDYNDPQKISSYIYQAFTGDADQNIDTSLKDTVEVVSLVDLLDFDTAQFEKTISLNGRSLNQVHKWDSNRFGEVMLEQASSSCLVNSAKGNTQGKYPFYTCGVDVLTSDNYKVSGKNIYFTTGGTPMNAHYFDGEADYSSDTMVVQSFDEQVLDTKFVFYWLFSNKDLIHKLHFKGTGLKHLQKPALRRESIPTPPIAVQKKIISELDKLKENGKFNKDSFVKALEASYE